MHSTKRNNESEMGSGDSDDEFYNVKLPCTPEVASVKPLKRVEVKKVYSPPKTKVQYNYKFDSSSDEEFDGRGHHRYPKMHSRDPSESSRKSRREEGSREKGSLSQNTCKVVEKINEELRTMKNSGSKLQSDKLEGQNNTATSVSSAVSVARPSISVVPPVVVMPPPMVVQQASVMGPMIVPSALGMGGPMAMMGNMMRGPSTMGLAGNTLSSGMMGMNAVPGMMGVQGNIVGMTGGMISPAAMSGINMGMAGGMMRMPGAGNNVFRMQGAGGNMLGISRPSSSLPTAVPRPVSMPTTGNLMVNNAMIANPGGLMVMGGMMGSSVAGGSQPAGSLAGSSNMVRMVSSPQGNLPIRVPPPPPFLNFRGRPPVPPGNFRWQTNSKAHLPKAGSPTTSSPNASSPCSSPLDKSSRDYDGEEYARDDKEKSPSPDSDESQSPPREMPNTFKNDGSFMEMFKKMTGESEGNQEAASSQEKASEPSDSSSTLKRPAVMLSGIVGKRRGGRVLKTGLVKKVKKEGDGDDDKHPKDAWSMYMAEVKKYREASCEEEGKTRPLVK